MASLGNPPGRGHGPQDAVVVPPLVGLDAARAREVAHAAGLFLENLDPDGPPLESGIIVNQQPSPGQVVMRFSRVVGWATEGLFEFPGIEFHGVQFPGFENRARPAPHPESADLFAERKLFAEMDALSELAPLGDFDVFDAQDPSGPTGDGPLPWRGEDDEGPEDPPDFSGPDDFGGPWWGPGGGGPPSGDREPRRPFPSHDAGLFALEVAEEAS